MGNRNGIEMEAFPNLNTNNHTTGVYQGRIVEEYGKERQCIPVSFSTYRHDEIRINNTNRDL